MVSFKEYQNSKKKVLGQMSTIQVSDQITDPLRKNCPTAIHFIHEL